MWTIISPFDHEHFARSAWQTPISAGKGIDVKDGQIVIKRGGGLFVLIRKKAGH
jgi:hypothetical protein